MEPQSPVQSAMQQSQTQLPPITPNVLQTSVSMQKKKLPPSLSEQQAQGYNPAALSQAIAMLNPNSKDPMVQIGKAIQTPDYAGYCLKWVDDKQGNQNRLPTAYDDYQVHAQSGDISTSDKIPQNARVYFSPSDSNGGMGHVGISNGDGTFTSATDSGIKKFNIGDWEKATGQSYLGFAPSTKSK